MKTIILLRHAKAEKTVGVNDFDRKLSKKGGQQLPLIAAYLEGICRMEKLEVHCSAAKRTRLTLKGVEQAMDIIDKRFEKSLYLAHARDLLTYLNGLDTHSVADTILLIGHNNGISDLANYLTEGNLYLSTGDVVVLQTNSDDWSELSAGTADLMDHFSPRLNE
jgi:phosphohistidine phosphatase